MSPEFFNSSDGQTYAEWHVPLMQRLFGDWLDLQLDLYERTHFHRREHNGGEDDGACTARPSPPYRTPVWKILTEPTGATRFLEVGAGLGYTASQMQMQVGLNPV